MNYITMRYGNYKSLTRLTAVILVLLAGAVILSAFYAQGYRVHIKPFRLVAPGSVTLSGVVASDVVYVDGKRVHTNATEGIMAVTTSAGIHSFVISRTASFPWAKGLTIKERSELTVNPFFVPRQPETGVIGSSDSRYAAKYQEATQAALPTESTPRKAQSSNQLSEYVAVFVQGTSIFASWMGAESTIPPFFCAERCLPRVNVLDLKGPITALDFYPGRSDVILFATGNQISAIEIDRRGIQNFQPVYTGSTDKLTFTVSPDGSLFVADGSELVRIDLSGR